MKADFFSVFLSVFGFGGLMFGFTNIENYPFAHPLVWLPMVVGMVGHRMVHPASVEATSVRGWSAEQERDRCVTVRCVTVRNDGL